MEDSVILGIILCAASLHCALAFTSVTRQVPETENVFNPKPGEVILGFAAEDLKQFALPYPKISEDTSNSNEVINGQTVFVSDGNSPSNINTDTDVNKVNEGFSTPEPSYLPSFDPAPGPNNNIQQPQDGSRDDSTYTNRIDDVNPSHTGRNDAVFHPAYFDDIQRMNKLAPRKIYEGRNDIISDPVRPSENVFRCGTTSLYSSVNDEHNPISRPFYPPWLHSPYPFYPERFRRMSYMGYNPEMNFMPDRMYGSHLPYFRYPMMGPPWMNRMPSRLFTYPMMESSMMSTMPLMMHRMFPPPLVIFKLLQPIIIKTDNSPFTNYENKWRNRRYLPERFYNNVNERAPEEINNFGVMVRQDILDRI